MTATTANPVLTHRDALLDVFTEVVQDCALNDQQPAHLTIARYGTEVHVSVLFGGQDVAAVDGMAGAYGLPPSVPGIAGAGNYARMGRLDVVGHRVEVTMYCGLPKLPSFPTGYTPQPVADERNDEPSAGGPATTPCAECHGAGGRQQLDGLIVECPRGCMTADSDGCTECGGEVSRPGLCFDCDVRASYGGGIAPRFGAQP